MSTIDLSEEKSRLFLLGSSGSTKDGDGISVENISSKNSNLPMHHALSQSRIKNSVCAQNSVAQVLKNKSDLPVSGQHQRTEHKIVTGTNQRTSPCITRATKSNFKHDHPKTSMTPSAQKRFPNPNGTNIIVQKEDTIQHQHREMIRKITSGIFFDVSRTPLAKGVHTANEKEQKHSNHDKAQEEVPIMEPEVDTQDTSSSRLLMMPLHRMLEVESPSVMEEHLEKIAAAEVTSTIRTGTNKTRRGAISRLSRNRDSMSSQSLNVSATPVSSSSESKGTITPSKSRTKSTISCCIQRTSTRKYKKLTLSAYRKPEETVCLTGCDASRLLENEYNLRAPGCKIIGHGAFSTVRSALRITDGTKVAIKSISKFDALRARRLRRPKGSKHMDEWEIMKLLRNNPHVLTLYDVFETDEEIHLVTEFCRGGELFDAIKRKSTQRSSFRRGRFSEAQAARITNQILKAIVELHALGIVHRDIKAENILLLNNDESDMKVKLCDFGMARLYQQTKTQLPEVSSDGELSPSTPGLLFGCSVNTPPEGFHGSTIGPATDIFSLGVTLYILLCGFPPVFCENFVEFPEAYWNDISEEAKDVVRSMLHHDPQQRISAVDLLKKSWIRHDTSRFRRGSISADLEMVRVQLIRSLEEAAGCPSKGTSKRRGFGTGGGPNKRPRLSSLDISLSALYSCTKKRDIRVIEERVESRTIGGEERGEGMACS